MAQSLIERVTAFLQGALPEDALPHPESHTDRIYAIGDVHGCIGMLQALLMEILTDAVTHGLRRPKVIFIGDLIARGPNTKAVLDLLLSEWMHHSFEVVLIRGNHEQWFLDALQNRATSAAWLESLGRTVVSSYGIEVSDDLPAMHQAFWSAIPDEHIALIASSILSHRVGRYFFSHGGLNPHRALDDQLPADLYMGCRAFWEADQYPEAVIAVHGHVPMQKVARVSDAINLDTGSGFFNGRLSAVALDPDGWWETFVVGPAAHRNQDIPEQKAFRDMKSSETVEA